MSMVSQHPLPRGLKLVAERVPEAHSVHLGAWLRCGTRYESPAVNGLSHFLEHMVFKGTRGRDALALARDLEALGGQFDAYTTHEATCYTLQVLPEHTARALELLGDLILGAPLDPGELETEKNVVVEEILEAEDAPADLVNELAASQAWGDHPLGLPVLGTAETVQAFSVATVERHRQEFYTSERLLLAAVGDLQPQALAELAEAAFAALPCGGAVAADPSPTWHSGLVDKRLAVDQIHLCLAAPGLATTDPDRYALWLLDSLLGATMSSRLFQEIREARGLAYQIGSSWQAQRDVGLELIEAVAHPRQIGEVLRLTMHEIGRLLSEGVSEEDLAWAKEYSRTTAILTFESLGSRLGRLARGFFHEQRYLALEETLQGIAAVSQDDLIRVAQRVFGDGRYVLGVVGPVTPRRAEAWWKVVQP